jgi:hypothetical protein
MSLLVVLLLGAGLGLAPWLRGQGAQESAGGEAPPPVPKGVEVMARGPIHEAFASPTTEPAATKAVPKKPPLPINEVPPEEKPEGDVVWIGGYWAWDDDRSDFLWVSGIWRAVPPKKQWVAGYWKEDNEQWQYVPGFWTEAAGGGEEQTEAAREVTYLPEPPKPPAVASPGDPPSPESFYVPGCWVWNGDRYAWRVGYWARVQPGYVWVPSHYQWAPSGYVYVAGYWDLAVSRRGFMYAPVVVDYTVVGPTFVYTPAYAIRDTVVLEALFVRPCFGCYYFGDYYGPRYRTWGFESCVVYSRGHYDALVVYGCYERRSDPSWLSVQINISLGRDRGTIPCPPRTLVAQNTFVNNTVINNTVVNNTVVNNTVVNNTNIRNTNVDNTNVNNTNIKNTNVTNTMISPATKLAAEKHVQVVKLDPATRTQALQHARAVQTASVQRSRTELASKGIPTRPRTAALSVPAARPVRTPAEQKAAAARNVGNTAHTGTTAPARNVAPGPRTGNAGAPLRNGGKAPPSRNTAPPGRYGQPMRPGSAPPSRPGAAPSRNTYPPNNRQPPPNNRQPPPNNRQPPPKDKQPPDKKTNSNN